MIIGFVYVRINNSAREKENNFSMWMVGTKAKLCGLVTE